MAHVTPPLSITNHALQRQFYNPTWGLMKDPIFNTLRKKSPEIARLTFSHPNSNSKNVTKMRMHDLPCYKPTAKSDMFALSYTVYA